MRCFKRRSASACVGWWEDTTAEGTEDESESRQSVEPREPEDG